MGRSGQPAIERRREILQILQGRNSVSILELSRRLGVSHSSVRRDLKALERKEAIVRAAHGTVMARKPPLRFLFARAEHTARDHGGPLTRIGRYAAQLISANETIFVNHGMVTLELVRELARRSMPVTIVTSSVTIASELWGQQLIRTLLIGGQLSRGQVEACGPLACHSLEVLAANAAFIACDATSSIRGVGFDDAERGQLASTMLANAGRKCVLADATMLGKVTRFSPVRISGVDLIITDACVSRLQLRQLVETSVDVRVVNGQAQGDGRAELAERGVDLLGRESNETTPVIPGEHIVQPKPRTLIGAATW
jgi:DeoR family transcriptional regulator of aga operon